MLQIHHFTSVKNIMGLKKIVDDTFSYTPQLAVYCSVSVEYSSSPLSPVVALFDSTRCSLLPIVS